jgi:rhodanese-related sulfurtransferase
MLYEEGFSDVRALTGGLAAWRDAGYPVASSN